MVVASPASRRCGATIQSEATKEFLKQNTKLINDGRSNAGFSHVEEPIYLRVRQWVIYDPLRFARIFFWWKACG